MKDTWGTLNFKYDGPIGEYNLDELQSGGVKFYDFMTIIEKRIVLVRSFVSMGVDTLKITKVGILDASVTEELEITLKFSYMLVTDYIIISVGISGKDDDNLFTVRLVYAGRTLPEQASKMPILSGTVFIPTAQRFINYIWENRSKSLFRSKPPLAALMDVSGRVDAILAAID